MADHKDPEHTFTSLMFAFLDVNHGKRNQYQGQMWFHNPLLAVSDQTTGYIAEQNKYKDGTDIVP